MIEYVVQNLPYFQAAAALAGIIAFVIGFPLTLIAFYWNWKARRDNKFFATDLPAPTEANSVIIDFDETKKDVPGTFEHAVAQFEKQLHDRWKPGMIFYPRERLVIAKEITYMPSIAKYKLASIPLILLFFFIIGVPWQGVLAILFFAFSVTSPIVVMLIWQDRQARNASVVLSQYIAYLNENGISVGPVFTRQKIKQMDPIVARPKAA